MTPFAETGFMEYLTHLRLIQKNKSALRNYSALLEHIFSFSGSVEQLRNYLYLREPFFFAELCSDSQLLRETQDELKSWSARGVHFTYIGDPQYPAAFLYLPEAPLVLSFRGHPSWTTGACISVVGSRDASTLSHLWMEEYFAEFLKQEKAVVVSGGARGIDQMAHQLALRNDRPTVVVLPAGLGSLYPSSLESWQSKIIDGGGCLLSEYSYFETMKKHFFHDRNRLIAGLGIFTLLVEARRRSGSLLTAQKTLQLGKGVLVVPGHPCESSHLGNLDLFTEGATPIRDAQDLSMYFKSELSMASLVMPSPSEA